MKLSNVWPAVGLWIVLAILFYIVTAASPDTSAALSTNLYTVGTLLAVLIGFWAGKLVGRHNYAEGAAAGIATGLGCAIPWVILFGYGAGALSESVAFGTLMVVTSIGSAIVGNAMK